MKRIISILISLTFLLISGNYAAAALEMIAANGEATSDYAVRVYFDDPQTRRKLMITFEPLEADADKDYVVVEVDKQQQQRLENLGLRVEPDATFTDLIQNPVLVQRSSQAAAAGGIPGFACYRTVEETFATAQSIASNYPTLATWSDVGDSWEKTNGFGGYDMQVLKLTNSAIPGPKPKAFITSSIHAREYAPAELMTRLAEHLVSQYGIDADITWILDHHETHLMLHANPDGRKQAETGILWRKNTNQNYCGTTSTSRGADLNRNFDFEWDCCGGSSNNQCNNTYHGSGPASEPETQAIQNYLLNEFVDNRGPNSNDAAPANTTGLYLDIHSHGELILWPWGSTNTVAPNGPALQTLGRKLAYANGHIPEQAIGLYPTDGTTDDFAYGGLGLPAYTYELGNAFFQDCATFESTIVPTNIASLLYGLKTLRLPYQLPAGPEIVNTDLNLGDSFPVPAGTPVTVSAFANDTRYNNSNGTEASQNIIAAEYTIDTPPWEATATPIVMSASDGNFNNGIETIEANIDTSNLAEGTHTVYVRGKDADNNWGTISAVFLNIDNSVVLPTLVFEDDFETDKGWTANPGTTDTATTGQWERANPEPTNSSGPKQLGTTVSGSFDLVTGATAGSSVGVNDIDSGVTSIRSPDIILPAGGPFTLSFSYYMAHTNNSTTEDFLRISIVGNNSAIVLEELGGSNDDDGVWQSFSTNIDAFAGQTIHLLVAAADAGDGSIVEAGIDDISIEGLVNTAPSVTNPGAQNNDEGDTVSLQIVASDDENDTLSYSATGLPTGLSIDNLTGLITGNLPTSSSNVYNVVADVNDGSLADSVTFIWTVNDCPDSDNDGLDDCFEQQIGTDPNLTDTDSDGLTDFFEVSYDGDANDYDPYNPATMTGGDLNALVADTDGDGFDDSAEITAGSDPLDSENTPVVAAAPLLGLPALTIFCLMLLGFGLQSFRIRR